jgi:hypothetical protein
MKRKSGRAVSEHPLFRAERELASDQKRIDWLLAFANQPDVEKLSSDKVDEVHDYLFAFAANRASSFGTEEEWPRTAAALFEIQDAVRSGLRQAIKLDNSNVGGFAGWEVALDGVKRRTLRGQHPAYQGSLRTVFLAAVADVIANDREKRLEMCTRPTCERFFWKRGRMKYCSNPCADADRQKRWRNKEEGAR